MCDAPPSGVLHLDRLQIEVLDLAAELTHSLEAGFLTTVREDERYHQPHFIELAINRCCERRSDAVRWGKMAVTATASRATPRSDELRGLAWAVLADAYRRDGALRRARPCAARAAELLEAVADPRERVLGLSLTAAVFGELCEESRAQQLLLSGLDVARRLEDPALIARLEIQLGILLTNLEAWGEAVLWLRQAADRLDGASQPRLALVAGHTMAQAAIGLGESDAGVDMLWELDELYRRCGSDLELVSRRWFEARAEAARGRRASAIARLRAVERDLTPVSMFHAAQAALERAELEVAERRFKSAEATVLSAALALDRVGCPTETVRLVLELQRTVALGGDCDSLLAEVAKVRRAARRRV